MPSIVLFFIGLGSSKMSRGTIPPGISSPPRGSLSFLIMLPILVQSSMSSMFDGCDWKKDCKVCSARRASSCVGALGDTGEFRSDFGSGGGFIEDI